MFRHSVHKAYNLLHSIVAKCTTCSLIMIFKYCHLLIKRIFDSNEIVAVCIMKFILFFSVNDNLFFLQGESDDCIVRLGKKDGILAKNY